MLPATVRHMATVFSIVKKNLRTRVRESNGRSGRERSYLTYFLNTTLQVAVMVNLQFVKKHLWKSAEQFFNEIGRLIRDQEEIIGMKND